MTDIEAEVIALRAANIEIGLLPINRRDVWLVQAKASLALRKKFPSDEQYGRVIKELKLNQIVCDNSSFTLDAHTRAASLWAAEFPEQLRAVEEKYPKLRVGERTGFRKHHEKAKVMFPSGDAPEEPTKPARKKPNPFGKEACMDDVFDQMEQWFQGDEVVEACRDYLERRSGEQPKPIVPAGVTVEAAIEMLFEAFDEDDAAKAMLDEIERRDQEGDE